jgi:hypothetical protein
MLLGLGRTAATAEALSMERLVESKRPGETATSKVTRCSNQSHIPFARSLSLLGNWPKRQILKYLNSKLVFSDQFYVHIASKFISSPKYPGYNNNKIIQVSLKSLLVEINFMNGAGWFHQDGIIY